MIYKSILLILGYLYGTMLTATFVVKHSTGNDVSKIGSGNPGMANVMEHIGKNGRCFGISRRYIKSYCSRYSWSPVISR